MGRGTNNQADSLLYAPLKHAGSRSRSATLTQIAGRRYEEEEIRKMLKLVPRSSHPLSSGTAVELSPRELLLDIHDDPALDHVVYVSATYWNKTHPFSAYLISRQSTSIDAYASGETISAAVNGLIGELEEGILARPVEIDKIPWPEICRSSVGALEDALPEAGHSNRG